MPNKPLKGIIFYTEVGNGFKSPAQSLEKAFIDRGCVIKLENFFNYIGAGFLEKFSTRAWKFMLHNSAVFDFIFASTNNSFVSFSDNLIYRRYCRNAIPLIEAEKPDFIISTYPFGTNFFARLVKENNMGIRVYGYNSDVILSHKEYVCNEVEGYFVSTDEGFSSMVDDGMHREKLRLVDFPIDKKFTKKFREIGSERKSLGLSDKFTMLLVFGGEGIGGSVSLVKGLLDLDVQLLVACGKNERLRKLFEPIAMKDKNLHLYGFVQNMHDLMYCSDIIAGKSGLNTVFESIFLKKPFMVITAMANEKIAARLIVRKNIGWWPKKESEIIDIAKKSLADRSYLAAYRKKVASLEYGFGTQKLTDIVKNDLGRFEGKKYLLFDLAGTLCDIPIEKDWEPVNLRGIEKVFMRLGLDKIYSEKEFRGLCREFVENKVSLRKLAKENLKEYEIKNQIADYLSKKKVRYDEESLEELEELFISTELEIATLFEGASDVLKKLSKKYRLILVSNNASGILVHRILQRFGISRFFSEVFISSEIGYRKPSSEFITAVLRKIKAKPGECIMIGDRLNQDMKMANDHGISSIRVNITGHEDNKGTEGIRYDHEVRSLNGILKILI